MKFLIKTPELIKEPIRYLGWKQPYGTLMLHEKIETRTWGTNYRGLVLICASQTPYSISKVLSISEAQTFRIDQIIRKVPGYELFQAKPYQHLPMGKAIAVGRLVESRQMLKSDEERTFVQYDPDLFCHIYEDVTPITPFEIKGCQGWKKLDSGIWDKIEFVK